MKRFKHLTGPYYSIAVFFILILVFLTASRLFLLGLYHSRIDGLASVLTTLINGLRIDIVLTAYCVSLPVLLAPFLEGDRWTGPFFRKFTILWFTGWTVFIAVILGFIVLFASAYGAFRLSRSLTREPSTWHPISKLVVLPFLAALLFLGARSSLGHRGHAPSA